MVCDGQRGILKAVDQLWPGIVIQRCHVHVERNIRTKLTRNPRTDAGADLQWLMNRLDRVDDEVSMAEFMALFDALYNRHGSFLNERTYNANPEGNKKWWYTHGRVRKDNNGWLIGTWTAGRNGRTWIENPRKIGISSVLLS